MLERRFNEKIAELGLKKKSKVAIAVSGGGDSMALILLAGKWAAQTGAEVIALTVDHNLRAGSKKEAEQVAEWMNKLRIRHHILANKKKKPQSGMMDFARKVRYRLMADYCIKNNIKYLLVAHNFEDQVETFLMRLERGSGVDGLAAIPETSVMNGIKILRPCLAMRRADLRKYLKSRKQAWLEDPTNENIAYKRNSLRKVLGGLKGKDSDLLLNRLYGTTISMRRARQALDYWVKQEIKRNFKDSSFFPLEIFKTLPEEIALRILKRIIIDLGGKEESPRFASLLPIYEEICAAKLKGRTLGGCKITLKKNDIFFAKE